MPHFIYALHCPIAGTVRYIGKSVDPQKRFRAHLNSAKNLTYKHHASAWLRKLLSEDLQPEMLILEEVPNGGNWQEAERRWIARAGSFGWKLTNSTAGGEGLDYVCPVAAAAYKENHRAAMKKYWASPAGREKAVGAGTRIWASPGAKEKRAKSIAKHYADQENRIRAAEVLLQIMSRPEVRAKMSEAGKRNHPKSALLQVLKSPEFSAEQSKRMAKRWTDTEAREKVKDARWSDEQRAAQAAEIASRQEKMKASITPEVLEKRNAAIKASWARRKAEKLAKPSAPV